MVKSKIITSKNTIFNASAMAQMRSQLFWIVMLSGLVVCYQHLGPTSCHETMVNNKQHTLLNKPERQDLRVSPQCYWGLESSGLWHTVAGWSISNISKALRFFQTSGTTNPEIQHHITEDLSLNMKLLLEMPQAVGSQLSPPFVSAQLRIFCIKNSHS
jgi:hypothetical protein